MKQNYDLASPPERDAPLIALLNKAPHEMTDAELAALNTKLRGIRTTPIKKKQITKVNKQAIDLSGLI